MTTQRRAAARYSILLIAGFWRVQNADLGLLLPAAYLPRDKMRAVKWALANGVIVD